jgi:GDP-L-fucose synthase
MDDCRRVVARVDYVFMCAAQTSGAGVIAATPLVHVTPNVVMNAQMLDAAYCAGVRKFLFISSNAAYPPTGERPVREEEMFDGEPYAPYYFAGWMKRYGEILCRTYAQKLQRPMATVVVRPSNVYGPFDDFDPRTSHMMAALIRRVVARDDPIDVWGTGSDVKDLIYIDDFLDGLLLAFTHARDFLEVNIAAGQGYSVRKVLDTILEVDGYTEASVRFDASKPRMIPARLIDISRARRVLGFEPRISLREGTARTVAWYRESRCRPS